MARRRSALMALRSRSSSSICSSRVIAWPWSSTAKLLPATDGLRLRCVKATGWRSCTSLAAAATQSEIAEPKHADDNRCQRHWNSSFQILPKAYRRLLARPLDDDDVGDGTGDS